MAILQTRYLTAYKIFNKQQVTTRSPKKQRCKHGLLHIIPLKCALILSPKTTQLLRKIHSRKKMFAEVDEGTLKLTQ